MAWRIIRTGPMQIPGLQVRCRKCRHNSQACTAMHSYARILHGYAPLNPEPLKPSVLRTCTGTLLTQARALLGLVQPQVSASNLHRRSTNSTASAGPRRERVHIRKNWRQSGRDMGRGMPQARQVSRASEFPTTFLSFTLQVLREFRV